MMGRTSLALPVIGEGEGPVLRLIACQGDWLRPLPCDTENSPTGNSWPVNTLFC